MKNLKILLLLLLFAFAGNDAWGNNWWCYQIEVDVKLVTGEGLVYDPDPGEIPGTIEVGEKNKNGGYTKSTQHSIGENRFYYQQHSPNVDNGGKGDEWVMKSAVPNTQNPEVSYIFKGWMYAGNAGDGSVVKHISTGNPNFVVGEYLTDTDYDTSLGGYAFYAKTQHKCAYTGEYGVSHEKGADHVKSHNNNPPVYTNDAIIYALFERQELTPAITIQYDVNKCEVDYPNDYQTNAIGKTITITARRKADTGDKGWEKDFVGWADEDGNIVSTDNPWTLTIEKKAVYRAVIEDRYRFFRIKNFGGPHRYVSAITDEASSNNFMDLMENIELLQLIDNKDKIIYDAGSIVQIDVLKNPVQTSTIYVDLEVQNSKASKFYIFNSGVTINSLPYDYITKTWNFKAPLALFRDDSGVPKMQANSDNYSKWIIEHIDLDLETKENYFSLDPAKLVQVGDKYYTTLRTSWNILFNPDQMTPYIVKSVNETEGTFEMEPITGNIIPAGTPVIIETNSNDVEENRMVPTLTAAASGAVPSGNLLQVSTKYFPNQSAPVANCKGLVKNSNGQLAFGGDALTTVNGNEAYLSIANEVVLPDEIDEITLGALVNDGNTARKHKVIDLTAVALAGNGSVIIAKDNAALELPATAAGEVDYMDMVGLARANKNRNNWVMLRVPDGQDAGTVIEINKKLANVQGRLVNAVNPEVQLDLMPQSADVDGYTPNTYIPASFYGTQVSPVNEKTYFFVQPQPMEYATVKWALWNGTQFTTVPITGHSNAAGLQGSFSIDDRYLINGTVDNLVSGHIYRMEGIAMVNGGTQAGAPALRAPGAAGYTFYPFTISQEAESVVTAVDDLNAADVVDVTYYDVTGLAAAVPHNGVNIVVTRHSDGTVTTTKVVR